MLRFFSIEQYRKLKKRGEVRKTGSNSSKFDEKIDASKCVLINAKNAMYLSTDTLRHIGIENPSYVEISLSEDKEIIVKFCDHESAFTRKVTPCFKSKEKTKAYGYLVYIASFIKEICGFKANPCRLNFKFKDNRMIIDAKVDFQRAENQCK